jgi:predicted RNA-binding protein with PUA-like domain
MRYWLLKSEPDVFSFDHLKKRPRKTEPWNGVRNYQARNFMRDDMAVGDLALFYHSSCPQPGVAGVARVSKEAYPDPTQFDPSSEYFDAGSKHEDPRWQMVDVSFHADVPNFVTLDQLRDDPKLADLLILRRGNRLSITPVGEKEFLRICQIGGVKLP